jgi:hypothetical protein
MNREVQRLRDSAHKAQKPHGDYALRGIEEFGTQGGAQRPQSLNGRCGMGCTGEFKAFRFGLEFAGASPLLRTLDRIETLAGGTHQFGGRD